MKRFENNGDFGSYLKQIWPTMLSAMTPFRAFNLVRCGTEYLLARRRMASLPPIYKFEISNLCNLRCPLCLHGQDADGDIFKKKRFMSLEVFTGILEQVHRHALALFLYHKGESFLNPDLLGMCRKASEKKVPTVVSSNLSLPFSDEKIAEIVDSGLSYLIVSCDGLSQGVYEQYRVGGDVGRVLNNMERITAEKRRRGSSSPVICWQYINFDHNRGEFELAAERAAHIGVDHFVRLKNLDLRTDHGYVSGSSHDVDLEKVFFPKMCKWLWTTAFFLYDGEVVPCCYYDWEKDRHVGNATQRSMRSIWNDDVYDVNRGLVSHALDITEVPRETHCLRCPLKD